MRLKVILLVSVLLVTGLTTAFAGNELRLGTAGAQELRIPIGSRGTALGGAVVANPYGIESGHWSNRGLRQDMSDILSKPGRIILKLMSIPTQFKFRPAKARPMR